MAAEWFYTHGMGQQRLGPVDKEKLKQLATEGQLTRHDLVWTVGLPQWAEAGTVAGLFDGAASPVASAPQASPAPATAVRATAAPIGYYSASGGFPPRAAASLQGHA